MEIGKNMTAFIPAMHMSDVPLKNPEKKFKVGDKVKCRVLRVDPEKRKVHLTAKNILVNEDYPIVSNYDQQNVGKVTEGVVVSLSTEGILLQVLSLAQIILLFLGKRSISLHGLTWTSPLFSQIPYCCLLLATCLTWLCFLAGWAENWAKQYMQLPISAM